MSPLHDTRAAAGWDSVLDAINRAVGDAPPPPKDGSHEPPAGEEVVSDGALHIMLCGVAPAASMTDELAVALQKEARAFLVDIVSVASDLCIHRGGDTLCVRDAKAAMRSVSFF
jgi:putative hemolysin